MDDRVNFIDGAWYVAVTCCEHGEVEEKVEIDEAKTARMARVRAFDRHLKCQHAQCVSFQEQARKDEIVAAELEVSRVEALLADSQVRLDETLKIADDHPLRERLLSQARARVQMYESGPEHAKAHLEYVRTLNMKA